MQEAKRNINVMNAKKPTPRHIIIEFMEVKGKEKNLKKSQSERRITQFI